METIKKLYFKGKRKESLKILKLKNILEPEFIGNKAIMVFSFAIVL